MQEIVLSQQNLQVLEAAVGRLIIKNNTCIGVELEYGEKILARTVIITTGTYLKSRILVGDKATPEGPDGQRTTFGISNQLRELGFRVQRLKTGTPPRVLDTSINYEETRYEPGMGGKLAFSFSTDHHLEVEKQEPC